jgi:hypothetical protein
MDVASLAGPALQALPFPLFIVDHDVRLLAMNERAARLVGAGAQMVLHMRGGEALNCIHHGDSPDGCGHGPSCGDCVVRNAVNASFAGRVEVHQRARMELRRGEDVTEVFVLVSASPFMAGGETYSALVLEDLSEMLASSNFVPVCMGCKRIRQDEKWEAMETYLRVAMDLRVTHSLCPVCMAQMYPEFGDGVNRPA